METWIRIAWTDACLRNSTFAALTLFFIGCGRETRTKVYPVSGSVSHAGAPAAGAKIVFYIDDRQDPRTPFPSAVTQDDGTFRLTSYEEGDGAPAGTYRVTVQWFDPIPPGVHKESYSPVDRLRDKYATPDKSNIKVTVAEGENQMTPFELK